MRLQVQKALFIPNAFWISIKCKLNNYHVEDKREHFKMREVYFPFLHKKWTINKQTKTPPPKKKNPTTGIVTRFCQGVENKWQKLILVGMIMDNKHSEAVLFYSYTSLDCLVFYFSSALVISSPTASFFELLKRMFAGW